VAGRDDDLALGPGPERPATDDALDRDSAPAFERDPRDQRSELQREVRTV